MEGMGVLTSPRRECGGLTFSFAVLSVRIALNSKSTAGATENGTIYGTTHLYNKL